MKEEEKTIKTHRFANAQGAAINVRVRSDEAYQEHQELFDDPEHGAKVDAVHRIIQGFFPVKEVYENQRANRGRPFTVIKVTNHRFPVVPLAVKARKYRKPLEELGVEIVNTSTNSILYRIYCAESKVSG